MKNSKLEHILNCYPIIKTDIISGKGTNVFSKDGKKIIDFEAGTWCTALGHSHPRINFIIKEQIDKIMHVSNKLTCDVADVLAVNLLELLHFSDGKAIFLSSGSEAVELSIRLSKMITSRKKLLTFSESYLSAYSSTSFPRNKDSWTQVTFSKCKNCTSKFCSNHCDVLSSINFDEISAFVLESGNSGGKVLLPPYKLVKHLETEIKKHGGLIVTNEVTTGFGRTGEWFGFNHYDIQPDIVALGKSIGNGYPISAVVMRKRIANEIESKNFVYAQSHTNDPLGCVISNEVIKIINEENLINRSKEIGNFFYHQLKELENSCDIIKEVRARGLMIAVELNVNNCTETICESLLEEGFLIGSKPDFNTLRFYPALIIGKDNIINMCNILKKIINQLNTK